MATTATQGASAMTTLDNLKPTRVTRASTRLAKSAALKQTPKDDASTETKPVLTKQSPMTATKKPKSATARVTKRKRYDTIATASNKKQKPASAAVQKPAKTGTAPDEPKKRMKRKSALPTDDDDHRPTIFRKKAPLDFAIIRHRALTQRMFVIDRDRDEQHPHHPVETLTLAGTTGNVYTIRIDKLPTCDCPYARGGKRCKHVVYVLSRVLRVREDLEYQLGFTARELREVFANAPPLPSQLAEETTQDGHRKPVEGECPICCEDMVGDDGEEIVFCRAACGNNIHKSCFLQWAASKRGGAVTCPFCRTPWQADEGDVKMVAKAGVKNEEGYVNVASQLGLSGERDVSTYHQWWVRHVYMRDDDYDFDELD